jgi:hypothetical protein
MPLALLIPLLSNVALPLAMKLIDMYMKDPATVVTSAMWEDLKKHIPFEDLAGPK